MEPKATRIVTLPRLAGALVLAVGVAAVLVVSATLPSAQTAQSSAPLTPADQAAQALNTGRYDEVDGLLKGATDARATTLRARAAIARGRYADAEKLLAPAAAASPSGDAALELGLLQMYLGRRQDARRTLQRVLDGPEPRSAADFTRGGRAARALGQFKVANDEYFRRGNRLAASDVALNTAWGDLFLEKFDRPNALKSYQDALKADESHVAARIGLARVAAEGNPPAAREALEAALKINPNSVPAHLLSAELALDDRRRDEAEASIKKALEVNPSSLEAIALQAGAAFAANKPADVETHAQAALKINPTYGEVYRVVADHAARGYLFDEAAALVRKALIIDPNNAQAYADLGMYLLRTGDEGEARVALERAFKDDPFNVSTFNSLDLLDTLAKFETITDGDLVFRFHPEEVAVMREQAIPLAKEALAALSKRYQFTPKGPLLIEMFPKHDDFAVRTIGLPGMIGALGACFGRVVTLDSPRARTPGEFNWGETLWHELAHVITLQMSGNRVPRWLTEGISVFEERRAQARVGQGVRRLVRAGARRRQGDQARRAERRFQRSEDHLAGLLPGVAGGGPPGGDPRRAGAVEDAARVRPRARDRGGAQGRLRHLDRAAPNVVRRLHRQALRRDRARAQGAGAQGEAVARRSEEAGGRQPRELPRAHDARRCAQYVGRQGRGDQDVRARRGAAAHGQRPWQPPRLYRAHRHGAGR